MLKKLQFKIFKIFVAVFWCVILTVVAIGSVKSNPLSFNPESKATLTFLLPQGWSFFTRSPRENKIFIYKWKNNKFQKVDFVKNRFHNYLGLNRAGRSRNQEMAFLVKQIKGSSWKSCRWCLDLSLRPTAIKNKALRPAFCGKYRVVLKKLPPWAWGKSGKEIMMPGSAADMEVNCSKRRS
jgi:antimicrobial peptide system SdpA family protein